MNRKDELKAIAKAARDELNALEAAEKLAVARPLVGKCYVYRNCYSCPEGPADYWPMYLRVTGINDNSELETVQFQQDKYGKIFIEAGCLWPHMVGEERYREITPDAMRKAWRKLLMEIAKIELLFASKRL